MVKQGDNPTNVNGWASMFWDDAWFLSWLWIQADPVPTSKPAPKKSDTTEKTTKANVKDDGDAADPSKKAWTQQWTIKSSSSGAAAAKKAAIDGSAGNETVKPKEFKKDDIKPTLTEARVIKKADPSWSWIDDLIDKKRKEASYDSNFRSWWWGWWPRGPSRWWGWWRWWRPSFSRNTRKPSAKVNVGATRRGGSGWTAAWPKKDKVYKVSDSLKKKGTIAMGETIVVKEFSEKMWVALPEVIKVLLANKILVAAQASIDFDTATLIAAEFDVTVTREAAQASVEDILDLNLQAILDQDKEADDLQQRPPIVTIMGHVDHWKTKLLDYLRNTDMVGGEAWWITQSIWASQIKHNDQKITFIDTPWHALFGALRARGSKITNIVIIVVAADDGVKPQTIEAIHHAQDAWVPIIVAITKIDLWIWKLEEIKWQLWQHGLQPEDRGGDVMIVPISSMTGQWVDDLLDAVILQYEMLELNYSPSRDAVAVVVESQRDAKQWVTTSMIVMTWTLKVGDVVVVHNTYWKVRRMTDWTWKIIKKATWWDPVRILWIQQLPEPGRVAEVVKNEKEASKKVSVLTENEHELSKEAVLQSLADKIGKGETVTLKLILKSDSFWSLEAMKHAVNQIEMPTNVGMKIINADVGSITDWDVTFAQAAEAIILWFNVWASGTLKKKADQKRVVIKEFDIIYQLIEYVEAVSLWMVQKEYTEERTGKLEVLAVFFRRWKEMIFWWKVTEGKAKNGVKFKIFRWDDLKNVENEEDRTPEVIGTITSLQREQESVNEVAEGYECGMKWRMSKKLEVWDIIEFYEMVEVK